MKSIQIHKAQKKLNIRRKTSFIYVNLIRDMLIELLTCHTLLTYLLKPKLRIRGKTL